MSKHPMLENVLSVLPQPTLPLPFALRPLLESDLPVLHQWVNQPYAVPFWNMHGPFSLLAEAWRQMTENASVHSLAICLDGRLTGQLDLYDPAADPIAACYPVQPGDLGIHLLIAPPDVPVPGFTARILYQVLETLFTAEKVARIVGEPDERNGAANRLLQKLSFTFHRPISLPDKQANLYSLDRQQFHQLPADCWQS